MAIVFFDGFEHALHPDYWTGINTELSVSQNGRSYGSHYNGALNLNAGNFLATRPRAAVTFTAQTTGTLYVGFAVNGLGDSAWRTLSEFRWPRNQLPVLSFYSSSGAEKFSLGFEPFTSPTPTLAVMQAGNYLNSFEITKETGDYYVDSNDGKLLGWNHFEFEIAGIGTASAATISVRRNGVHLYPLIFSTGTTIDNIAKIELGSGHSNGSRYDDFYVINNSGTTTNTWLGPETTVYSTSLTPATPAEWVAVNGGGINSDDADVSYFKTTQYPKTSLFSLGSQYGDLSTFNNKVIAGISTFARARKTSMDAAYQIAFKQATVSDTIHPLNSRQLITNLSYRYTPITFTERNPATNLAWTPADLFTNGLVGIQSVDPS